MYLRANLSFPRSFWKKKREKGITYGRWASVDLSFVESLYLCTQHLFMEMKVNDRGYSQPGRKMLMMIDTTIFTTPFRTSN